LPVGLASVPFVQSPRALIPYIGHRRDEHVPLYHSGWFIAYKIRGARVSLLCVRPSLARWAVRERS